MENFKNEEQSNFYAIARPKYTKEIFEFIIENNEGFDRYLDVACGTGQVNCFE